MESKEMVEGWFGAVEQLAGADDSVVLAQLPKGAYPDPKPSCATCPAKDWYLTKKGLRCYCQEHRYVSWVSNDDPVLVCDARERLIRDAQSDEIEPPIDYGG
ncbi:hypothetical protein QH494_12460 [Sphingomonas sp. AR_OL41]|uniref:hypothetical protein n=1 Tax=Sphingomonas sp. AR_OL41 TaxID=3042729 RepID=UPI0024812915|nr:hypothetical protein [Sphingomonas sp. AR_OL41]MDH7972991.1 hypothetical protein [Sphingomonas sp. AR_OL41]